MSTRLSTPFRQALLARATEQNLLVLLHVYWTFPGAAQPEHLRIALAHSDVVSNGQLYVARAFEFQLPDEGVDEEIPVARIALDGIPPEVRLRMRRLSDPPHAELIIVAKDDPDSIQWQIDGPIRVANYALPTMVVEIHTYENLAADPSVGYRFNPASGFRSFRSLA